MARDAARRFRELVAAGDEIPYDVEEPGNGSPLPRYVPLTERFVRDHAPALLELDSFGSACAAIESADLAGPYLEEFGIDVPPNAPSRAELAGTVFLCRLWADSTDFSLDGDRLGEAIAELEAGGRDQRRRDRGRRSRCAACRCPWFAWSWRPRRSFARTRSTSRPMRAPRRGSAPPAGSPPSSPRRASARARPASRMGEARTPGHVPSRLFAS